MWDQLMYGGAVSLVCTAARPPCLLPVLAADVYGPFTNNNKLSARLAGRRYLPIL